MGVPPSFPMAIPLFAVTLAPLPIAIDLEVVADVLAPMAIASQIKVPLTDELLPIAIPRYVLLALDAQVPIEID